MHWSTPTLLKLSDDNYPCVSLRTIYCTSEKLNVSSRNVSAFT
jgi:hypothetical protein